MANALTPTTLYTVEQGDDFTYWMNTNYQRLNDVLLYFSALSDVDDTGLVDGQILRYNSSSQKWEPKTPTLSPHTTTTTTTTSTTTTTV